MNTVNIMCVILSGLFMALLGVVLFVFQGQMPVPLRYFLPIPPIAVASYVFVFNMINDFNGLPQSTPMVVIEIIKSTIAAAVIYSLITSLIICSIKLWDGNAS